jgi:hypothetical protein
MKKFVILLATVMLSGCAAGLGPEFLTKAKEDLGMSPAIYGKAVWFQNVCGRPLAYSERTFGADESYPRQSGVLLVDDKKIAFVEYDKKIKKYDYFLQLNYPDVALVSVFKSGNKRYLMLIKANTCYTFGIFKGSSMDNAGTYEFAIFIADKVGKDSSEYSKELAKERGSRSVQ